MAQIYLNGVLTEISQEELDAINADRTPTLEAAKAAKIASVWDHQNSLSENGIVSVTTTAGTYNYGTDKVSRDNIQGVLIGVSLGVTPNLRPWSPKGASSPISVTHADLVLIGGTMMAAVDANIQAYLTHKFAINALQTVQEVLDYDITTGWPS